MQISMNFPRGENSIAVEVMATDSHELYRHIKDVLMNVPACPDSMYNDPSPCMDCYTVAIMQFLGV